MSDELRYLRREVARLTSSLAATQTRLAEFGDDSIRSLASAQAEARRVLGTPDELEAIRRQTWLASRGALQPHFDHGKQEHLFPLGWPDDAQPRESVYRHVGLTPDGGSLSDDSEPPSEDLPTFIHQMGRN
jgi:hypothetical protein